MVTLVLAWSESRGPIVRRWWDFRQKTKVLKLHIENFNLKSVCGHKNHLCGHNTSCLSSCWWPHSFIISNGIIKCLVSSIWGVLELSNLRLASPSQAVAMAPHCLKSGGGTFLPSRWPHNKFRNTPYSSSCLFLRGTIIFITPNSCYKLLV